MTNTRPQKIGPACMRVQQALDEALAEGALTLSPELRAHADRCPRCSAELDGVEQLLGRLKAAAAGVDLARLPAVVDAVLTATVTSPKTKPESQPQPQKTSGERRRHLTWVLGQVAAVAAVLVLVTGTLTWAVLEANQAISGTSPSTVVERLTEPFRNWTLAKFRDAK